jgi:hypothetical protein
VTTESTTGLVNTRKTERGAKPFLSLLAVRAAPFALAGMFLAAACPVLAHHSFAAEFDGSRTIQIKGATSRVEWSNPHSYFYVDVTDAQGKVVTWACESGAPVALSRRGLRRGDMKPGDPVIVDGYLAKDGSHRMNARRVTLPDGRIISRDPDGEGP